MGELARQDAAIAAVHDGNRAAFSELVGAHKSAVFAVAYSITGDRAASEDLAQEAFLEAWRGRSTLRDPSRFRSWVCGIARNLGRNENRRRSRHEALAERYRRERPATTAAPVAEAIERETEALLWHALRDVPERHREVLTLYYKEGRSATQVASALGISEALVCKRLARGRAALRDEVQRKVEDGLARLEPPADLERRVLAALPLGILPNASAGVGASHFTLGALVVSNTGKLVVAIVAAVLTVGLVWTRVAGDEGDPGALSIDDAVLPRAGAAAEVDEAPSAEPTSAVPALPARPAAPDGDQLTFEVEGDDGTLWYKLLPALRCERELELLEADLGAEPVEIALGFGPGPGGARLRSVTVAGRDGAEFERCALDALADVVFPAGTTAASAVLSTGSHPHPLPAEPAVPTERMFEGPSRGPADARVRILVYTDFQCSFCSKALVTLDQLVEEYPDDIRIITKLYPLKPSSRRLAEATAAAGEQGKFWEMHDLIFAYQDQGGLDDAELRAFADQLGLDLERFAADLDSEMVRSSVEADLAEGRALGVRGTPAFFVNESSVVGAQPIEVFRELVENELAEPAP